MKRTYYKISVLLLLPLLYYVIFTGFSANENINSNIELNNLSPGPSSQKDFVNYILNCDYSDYTGMGGKHMEYFLGDFGQDELHFNGVHIYDADLGTEALGWFEQFIDPNTQLPKVQSLVNGSHSNNLKAVFERSNVSNLCYAQRLVYEVANGNGHIDINDGFCYQTISGIHEVETDGTTAIHACVNPNECNVQGWVAIPQYICSNIYENFQHTDLPGFRPQERDVWEWHLKPRMKIKQSDFNDPNKQTMPVITIEAYAFNNIGNNNVPIATKTILVRNFSKQGVSYLGDYKEIFYNGLDEINMWIPGDETNGLNKGRNNNWWNWETQGHADKCHVDFKIYWHGNVDVWFDKLTVDDYRADRMFSPAPNNYDQFLNAELANFGGSMDMFFVDELVHSNIPCAKYVVDKVRASQYSDVKITMANTSFLQNLSMKNPSRGFQPFLSAVQPDYFQTDAHEISGWRDEDDGEFHYNYYPDNIPDNSVDNNVPKDYTPDGWKATYSDYTNWLQNDIFGNKNTNTNERGSFIYQLRLARDQVNTYSPGTQFIMQPQLHGFVFDYYPAIDPGYDSGLREPLDEEYSAQAMISIAHGADGLCWFWFQSNIWNETTAGELDRPYLASLKDYVIPNQSYLTGLINTEAQSYSHRTVNMWGQNKWQDVSHVNGKILSWIPTLNALTWQNAYSVHSEGGTHEFIQNILSIDPHRNDYNPCSTDGPSGPYYDCENERYWELGFFNNVGSTKYFMAVNRRCVPAGGDFPGDDRVLRVKFDANDFPNFNSWIISEVGSTTSPVSFSRNYNGYVDIGSTNSDMGWFEPGEGKLFKIEAIPEKGGTLVADEVISGGSFTCEAPVYNNGFNITIGANTTIHFNDSSKFVMSGGVFTVGDQNTSAPQNITSDAVPDGSWRGHSFTNCEVKIYGATFTGLANDTTYAVNIIDCPVVDIRNCTFNTNSSLKGGINAICFSNPFIAINNIYIGSNTFNSSVSTIPTVNVSSYAGVTTPLIIENNTFNEGNTAVFLSGVIGGAIKGNTITDNYISINALTSSIDVVQNNISSTVSGSMGIFAAGGSELKLNSSGAFTLGGLNNISNEGTGTNNINVDGSYFLLEGGENIFNISSDQSSYHLYGYFPMFTAVTTEETNNCFKVDGSPVDPPVNMVTSGYQGSQITFNFNPYLTGCEIPDGGDGLAIDLGNGIYDTIYTGGSGSGGSQKEALPLTKGEYPQGDGVLYTTPTAKTIYDSISVLMRYRNYTQAKTKCLDLINTYPDSIQSILSISKLFLSTVAGDTTYNAANNLKIFYENLILNHPGNTSLVKRANYYILKCKVRMREYSQALAGFQQIINQNPYSYEGLIARWDYMATSLLAPQGGSFGSAPTVSVRDNDSRLSIDLVNALQNEADGDDKNPFTKEQRQDIRKSITIAIEISKNDDEVKIKKLEEKSELGDVNASKELTQMKSLKQVVKTEKPKSIIEHVRIVSEDIRKVFGSNTSSKGNEPKNIPLVFRISQNYPNPFNPVTKINYDLPRDSKVKIVIYDILGREVKRLVNNELKTAGSYIVDFNAMNYASGVYFYRIEAEEPNGNKFVDSKKMVLLK